MRRSASLRSSANGGQTDKKSKTTTSSASKASKKLATAKHTKSNKSAKSAIESHLNHNSRNNNSSHKNHNNNNNHYSSSYHKSNMPVYNIIARRHKVRIHESQQRIFSLDFLFRFVSDNIVSKELLGAINLWLEWMELFETLLIVLSSQLSNSVSNVLTSNFDKRENFDRVWVRRKLILCGSEMERLCLF